MHRPGDGGGGGHGGSDIAGPTSIPRDPKTPPTSADDVRADLAKCPPWVLVKLRRERDMRERMKVFNDQMRVQTESLLLEVDSWKTRAFRAEALVKSKDAELRKVKELTARALKQLQLRLDHANREIKKKNEILILLKQRFEADRDAREARGLSSGPTSSSPLGTSAIRGPSATSPRGTSEKVESRSTIHRPTSQSVSSDRDLLSALQALEFNEEYSVKTDLELEEATPENVDDSPQDQRMPIVEFQAIKDILPQRTLLRHMLLSDDLVPIHMLCSAIPPKGLNKFTQHLLYVWHEEKNELDLMQRLIRYEVDQTVNMATMFRANSPGAKMMSMYIRMIGIPYLAQLLKPLQDRIIADDPNIEIDPFKEEISASELEVRTKQLGEYCQMFFDSFSGALEGCPAQFRSLCYHLQTEVSAKFPSDWPFSVGGFYFLRYLCPPMVAPEVFGLCLEQDTPTLRRALVLIGKCMQNLANGTAHFKEPFMMCMAPWITANLPKCKEFLLGLAQAPPSDVPLTPLETTLSTGDAIDVVVSQVVPLRAQVSSAFNAHPGALEVPVALPLPALVGAQLKELRGVEKSQLGSHAALSALVQLLRSVPFQDAVLDVAMESGTDGGGGVDWQSRVLGALTAWSEAHGRVLSHLIPARVDADLKALRDNAFLTESASSGLFRSYTRLLCTAFLKDVFAPVLADVRSLSHPLDLSSSSSSTPPPSGASATTSSSSSASTTTGPNEVLTVNLAVKLITASLRLLPTAPLPIWQILKVVNRAAVAARGHIPAFVITGQFLYHNLFIPAAQQPCEYGLSDTVMPSHQQEALKLMGSVMQCVVDGKPFPDPSGQLVKLNQFISKSAGTVKTFISRWMEMPPKEDGIAYPSSCSIDWSEGSRERSTALEDLGAFFQACGDEVQSRLDPSHAEFAMVSGAPGQMAECAVPTTIPEKKEPSPLEITSSVGSKKDMKKLAKQQKAEEKKKQKEEAAAEKRRKREEAEAEKQRKKEEKLKKKEAKKAK